MSHRLSKHLVLLGLLISVVGCGNEAGVGLVASERLTPEVQAIRAAAENGDREAATEKLAELRQKVAELRAAGQVSEAAASQILAAANEVEVQLAVLPSPTVESPPQGGGPDRGGTRTVTTKKEPDKDKEKENGKEEKDD